MKAFFKELFEYNHQNNINLIERSQAFESKVSAKSHKLFSHFFNAHEIWNARILSQKSEFDVWQMHRIDDWKTINQSKYEASLSIIEGFNLNTMVSYTNTSGNAFENAVRDILFHIINHSTYHRGQIATDFRANGIEPIVSDYIFYKR